MSGGFSEWSGFRLIFLILSISSSVVSATDFLPKRVVICYPSVLELWLECGGSVVGIHSPKKNETIPEAAKKAEQVGSYFHPNAEKIFHLNPDLVLLSGNTGRSEPFAQLLKKNGIRCQILNYENYSDYKRLARSFCFLNGQKELPPAFAGTEAEVEKILERSRLKREGRKPTTFLVFFFNGAAFRAETSSAHAAYIATQLGGINALKPGKRKITSLRVNMNRESLLLEDPDLIFLIPATGNLPAFENAREQLLKDPALQTLKAIRNNRLILLPADLFQYKPNRRFPEAFQMMDTYLNGNTPVGSIRPAQKKDHITK